MVASRSPKTVGEDSRYHDLDAAILEGLYAGDHAAREQLVRTYSSRLLTVLRAARSSGGMPDVSPAKSTRGESVALS